VRAYDRTMSFAETVKLLLVSFDSTLKSNLSVGLPLDLAFYEKDSFKIGLKKRIGPTILITGASRKAGPMR
jgi:putative proteasome-type protease